MIENEITLFIRSGSTCGNGHVSKVVGLFSVSHESSFHHFLNRDVTPVSVTSTCCIITVYIALVVVNATTASFPT